LLRVNGLRIVSRKRSRHRPARWWVISGSTRLHPTPADRFVLNLLRIGDAVDKNAIFGARRATTRAIVVSGIRCTITYLLIPLLAPLVGFLDSFGPAISIALCLIAIGMGISGVRRFWLADHPSRWPYTAFISVVVVLLLVAIGLDIACIRGRVT
jgi:hypothetical protein